MIYPWRWVVPLLLLIFYSDLSQLNHHVHALALNKNNNVLSVIVIVFSSFFSFTVYALSDTCTPSPTTLLFHIRLETNSSSSSSQTTYDTCFLSHYVKSRHHRPSLYCACLLTHYVTPSLYCACLSEPLLNPPTQSSLPHF